MTTCLKALQRILFIQYLVQFQAHQIEFLINSGSKIKAMTLRFVAKFAFTARITNVDA